MKYACFVVDDQPHGVKAVVEMIQKVPELILAGTATDPVTALNTLVSGTIHIDILFLDMEMPEINGIKFLEILGTLIPTVFVTGHTQFAFEAYQNGAVDYIKKPISLPEFLRALVKVKEKINARNYTSTNMVQTRSIFIKLTPRNIIRLNLAELIYISVNDKYIDLHVGKPKPISIKKALGDMENILPQEQFLRIHKSYLLNVDFVDSIVGNRIVLTNQVVLEIGSSYRQVVYGRLHSV